MKNVVDIPFVLSLMMLNSTPSLYFLMIPTRNGGDTLLISFSFCFSWFLRSYGVVGWDKEILGYIVEVQHSSPTR